MPNKLYVKAVGVERGRGKKIAFVELFQGTRPQPLGALCTSAFGPLTLVRQISRSFYRKPETDFPSLSSYSGGVLRLTGPKSACFPPEN